MKRSLLISLLLLVGMALAFPQPGFSWGGPVVAVAAGAAPMGAIIACPGYGYYGPPVVYGYPPPAYVYPAPVYGYGYPYYGLRHYVGPRYHGYYAGRGHYGHRW